MSSDWPAIRAVVLERDNFKCVECGKDLARDGGHVHHVMPRALGGSDEPSNLISLCQICHASVHPNLQGRLARRMLERAATWLAAWVDREGQLARATKHFGPALRLFGVSAFRPAQVDVVEAALLGKSLLLVSPTGSGKSLAFQLPAVLTPGLCVVIAPLKALMSDQVSGLMRRRLPATFINSDISKAEKDIRYELLRKQGFKFLYVAPERFFVRSGEEVAKLRALRPAYLVIDEAHCIDRWGADFRPEYGRLGEVRELLGNPAVLSFTATAGRDTQTRILESLGVPDARVFVHGVNRPNISFLRRKVPVDQRAAFIAGMLRLAELSGVKAMVFVPTRNIGHSLSEQLTQHDVPTPFFHGQLSAPEKDLLLQRFGGRLEPALTRIVCTNAFGMGVDISDVRLVIHWQQPASPEDYLQEFGRAGRDGRKSVAVLLTDPQPNGKAIGLLDFMAKRTIENSGVPHADWPALLEAKQRLSRSLERFAFAPTCFRDSLLAYFGETKSAVRRPLALRIIDWVFSRASGRIERGICCDLCHSKGMPIGDHRVFICEALGIDQRLIPQASSAPARTAPARSDKPIELP